MTVRATSVRAAVWLSLFFLAATPVFAQRPGGPGAPPHGAPGPSIGAGHPTAPRRGRGSYGYSGLPFYYDNYDYGVPLAPPPPMPQLPPYVVVQAPPPVVHPEVHEYGQASAADGAAVQPPPAFALALRDGSVHSAVAVAVQDDGLHYVDPDGRHEIVALEALDRDTTRRLNEERKLNLRLPVPAK